MKPRGRAWRRFLYVTGCILLTLGAMFLMAAAYDYRLASLYESGVSFDNGYTPNYPLILFRWFVGALAIMCTASYVVTHNQKR